MTDFLPVEEDEDFATWERFRDNPEVRWLFNKLEVALVKDWKLDRLGVLHRMKVFTSTGLYTISLGWVSGHLSLFISRR